MRFDPDTYISVHERIEKFYDKFPQGRILTAIVEHNEETGFILMRAEAYRDPADTLPAATGHAYELRSAGHVQAGSYVEVCETSAAGRALALLGFEVTRGVASREEVNRGKAKAQASSGEGAAPAEAARPHKPANPVFAVSSDAAGTTQVSEMQELADVCAVDLTEAIRKTFQNGTLLPSQLNKAAAAYMIDLLRRKKAELGITETPEEKAA